MSYFPKILENGFPLFLFFTFDITTKSQDFFSVSKSLSFPHTQTQITLRYVSIIFFVQAKKYKTHKYTHITYPHSHFMFHRQVAITVHLFFVFLSTETTSSSMEQRAYTITSPHTHQPSVISKETRWQHFKTYSTSPLFLWFIFVEKNTN